MPDDFARMWADARSQMDPPEPANAGLGRIAQRMETNAKGVPHAHVGNALLVLAYDPGLTGTLGYNEFLEEAQMRRPAPVMNPGDAPATGPYPRSIRASDIVAILAYVQRHHLPRLTRQALEDAVYAEAERNPFHPVRAFLTALRWDGAPRLDTWLCKAFGAEDTLYAREVGAKFLIAAVRRIMTPGSKFDTMPILEGNQGAGKSRTVARLFGADWFTDALPKDLLSKDGSQAMLGVWGIEFAEIEHLIRTDTDSLKAFLSRPTERFRPPYARNYIKRGRECVFIGTTNLTDYLRDTTGNRRFWPVACAFADEDWVRANRDQLWAEAVAREAGGEIIWLEDEARTEAAEHQAQRLTDDVWAERARTWLEQERANMAPHVTVAGLLTAGLGIDHARMGKKEEMRAAAILAKEGLVRETVWQNGKTRRVWVWPLN